MRGINKHSNSALNVFAAMLAAVFVISFVASCKKSNDVTSGTSSISSTRLRVVNLSPDLLPVNLFIGNQQINTINQPYRYIQPGAYFYLLKVGEPLQLRAAGGQQEIRITDTASSRLTQPRGKYTYIATGLLAENSIRTIFLSDTDAVPPLGQGKVRFVNASPKSVSLDVYANGTKLFGGIDYLGASRFSNLPAGNYNLKFYLKGDQTTILDEIRTFTVQDSRLYTLYARGIIGRTDSAVFKVDTLINK